MPRISLVRKRKPLRRIISRWQSLRRPAQLSLAKWLYGFRSVAVAQLTSARIILGLVLIPIVAYAIREAKRDVLIIDPFAVPKRFEEAGITSDVMANRIGDAIIDIETNTESTLARRDNLTPFQVSEISFNIEIPGTKIGLKTLIDATRTVFGIYPKHVSGDIYLQPDTLPAEPTPVQKSQVIVTVYLSEGRRRTPPITSKASSESVDVLAHRIAETVLEQINPYLLGAYKLDHGEVQQAGDLAKSMTKDEKGSKRRKEAAFNLWGNVLYAQGKNDEAIAKYQKVIELDPKFAPAYNNWGTALHAQGRNDEAIAKYQKATDLDPKYAYAYNNWGSVLYAQRKNDEAIAKYQKVIELDPKYVIAYNNWGNALQAEGKNDEAIAKYQKAIELDPKYAYAYNNWGTALLAKGKNEEAIAKYQKATELDPKYENAYNNWGLALTAQRRNDEAKEKFKKAAELLSLHSQN